MGARPTAISPPRVIRREARQAGAALAPTVSLSCCTGHLICRGVAAAVHFGIGSEYVVTVKADSVMFRPLPLAIALRYLRVRRRSRFVSVVALVAVLGVALGVGALIVVLSVMNGMQDTLTGSILGVTADVMIENSRGGALPEPATIVRRAERQPGFVAAAPYAQSEVILGRGGALGGAMLRGIDPAAEARVSAFPDHMLVGSLAALTKQPYGIVLGRDLALQLDVLPGDKVAVILPRGLATPVGFVPRMRRFTVVGVFAAGNQEYDSGLALTDLASADRLFGVAGPTGIRFKLHDPFAAGTFSRRLEAALPPGLQATTWEQSHRSLFDALANEERMMFVLVALAILIAAFNVLGVLTVLVADKRKEIGVLSGLGLEPRRILVVFLALGSVIGAFGIVLGLAGGLAVAVNVEAIVAGLENLVGHPLFAEGTVALAGLPSRVDPLQVAAIVSVAAVLVVLASWAPARRAARLDPVEALADG